MHQVDFPRHACLGLIEAEFLDHLLAFFIAFSEARVPRPH